MAHSPTNFWIFIPGCDEKPDPDALRGGGGKKCWSAVEQPMEAFARTPLKKAKFQRDSKT
jgi:hypothetical protein